MGDKCTIADISHWGWVASAGWSGIDIDEFAALKAWEDRILQSAARQATLAQRAARPGVEKGRHVPSPHTIKELLKDKAKTEEQAASARKWVQAGMQADAKKSSPSNQK